MTLRGLPCNRVTKERFCFSHCVQGFSGVHDDSVKYATLDEMHDAADAFPHTLTEDERLSFLRRFQKSSTLNNFERISCVACGKLNLISLITEISFNELLAFSSHLTPSSPLSDHVSEFSYDFNELNGLVLNKFGMIKDERKASICVVCLNGLQSGKDLNKLDLLANGFYRGYPPADLPSLTDAEEMLLSFHIPHVLIVTLRTVSGQKSARALKGNVIVYRNDVENVVNLLPRPASELYERIHVMFTGANLNPQALKFVCEVRPPVVMAWIRWLKKVNHLYKDVHLNEDFEDDCLQSLNEHGIPRCLLYYMTTTAVDPTSFIDQQSGYAPRANQLFFDEEGEVEVQFHRLCSTDLDPALSQQESLINLMKTPLYVHHRGSPADRFYDPFFFEKSFVTAFPFGVGGPKQIKACDREVWIRNLLDDPNPTRIVQRNHRYVSHLQLS